MVTDAHHYRNGLYVKRQPDGSVLLMKCDGADGPVIFETVIDVASWCRLVAAVSDAGITPQQIELAEIAHGVKRT